MLHMSSPVHSQGVSLQGFEVSGQASGARIEIHVTELEPRVPIFGQVQRQVTVSELVPVAPDITVTEENVFHVHWATGRQNYWQFLTEG
jgi:hypothetical protein